MIHNTQSAQISQDQDGRNIYVIMKTMFPPSHHHNSFVATRNSCTCAQVHELPQSHCDDNQEGKLLLYIY